MTQSVQEVLNSFDRLPESEQQEAFSEILKRIQTSKYRELTDEDLSRIADETFQMYDAEEAADGRG